MTERERWSHSRIATYRCGEATTRAREDRVTREELLELGGDTVRNWCDLNEIRRPLILTFDGPPEFGTCAYYRDGVIKVWPRSCASIGYGGRAWSAPGYAVDRTPYGVLAHELGHHVDAAHGTRGGTLSHDWRRQTGANALTGYAPNDNEWFAEMFRLFVTNPDLLRLLRPSVFALMTERWKTVETRDWKTVLEVYPRQTQAAWNKIRKALRCVNS